VRTGAQRGVHQKKVKGRLVGGHNKIRKSEVREKKRTNKTRIFRKKEETVSAGLRMGKALSKSEVKPQEQKGGV